jgi:hypothetical protein
MKKILSVAAVARINCMYDSVTVQTRLKSYFGKQCLRGDKIPAKNKYTKERALNPKKYLPGDLDETLQVSVNRNQDWVSFDVFTLTIIGDIKDTYDSQEIIDWFREKIENLNVIKGTRFQVKQAVIDVKSTDGPCMAWVYEEKKEKES